MPSSLKNGLQIEWLNKNLNVFLFFVILFKRNFQQKQTQVEVGIV